MFRTLRFYHSFFKFLSTPSSRRATQDQIHHLWRGGHFYPRPPRGGRLENQHLTKICCNISIHALREEGDPDYVVTFRKPGEFLSTPSARRATRKHAQTIFLMSHFYPRPPRGGRLPHRRQDRDWQEISIHALREEGDALPPGVLAPPFAFLSTPSARRATIAGAFGGWGQTDFYPRPPRGGRR